MGACRPGTQHCINGAFETTCQGAIEPAAERCNGLDDDCDGEVDEGLLLEYAIDQDGDGFGSMAPGAEVKRACALPPGFVANRLDCDDTRSDVNPSASEQCDAQGLDENCDGRANDGCSCTLVGSSQLCCAGRGTQQCEATDGGARLTSCSVVPVLESCNGVDDDCNGQTDDRVSLYELDGGLVGLDGGEALVDGGCVVGLGACARTGRAQCVAGAMACDVSAGVPADEVCNGLDDDCDGQVDEASAGLCAVSGQACVAGACACPAGQSVCGASCAAVGGPCSVGVGACARSGVNACAQGAVTCSVKPGAPASETCNGVDDDCDGQVDEAGVGLCAISTQRCTAGTCSCPSGQSVCGSSCVTLGGTCSVGVGACARSGTNACTAGAVTCNATAGTPRAETCNSADDDCDGQVDEATPGLCSVASQVCTAGACACPAGQSLCGSSCVVLGEACAVGVGACRRSGTNVCTAGARVCSASPGTPGAEVCNRVDDDCDGQTDEVTAGLCPATGQSCASGVCACPSGQTVCAGSCVVLGTSCAVGVGECRRTGTMVCGSSGATCSATPGTPGLEVCNGRDDDCDGRLDQGSNICKESQVCVAGACACPPGQEMCEGGWCITAGQACSNGALGVCAPAGWQCVGERGAQCVSNVMPSPEVCDNLDNDCDGAVDDGNPGGGAACITGEPGVCAAGARSCVGGHIVCARIRGPAVEVCNYNDDDCDGQTDEGFSYVMCLPDADRDGYADDNTLRAVCPVQPNTCPAGYLAQSASLGRDCRPHERNLFRLVSTRADADGDWRCTSAVVSECVGASLPAGRRSVYECQGDDCNDSSYSVFQLVNLRDDADSDGYCVGAATPACIGATAPAGRRIATACNGEDCRDSNGQVSTTCTILGGYETTSHAQACPNPVQRTGLTVVRDCDPGLRVVNLRAEKRSGGGNCSVVNELMIEQSCNFLEGSDCRIAGDCTAW